MGLQLARSKDELAYVEKTANAANTASTPTDVSGMTIDVIAPSGPYIVEFEIYLLTNDTGGGVSFLSLLEGATSLAVFQSKHPTANSGVGGRRAIRISDSVGGSTHTYKCQLSASTTTIATLNAGATTTKAWLRAYRV